MRPSCEKDALLSLVPHLAIPNRSCAFYVHSMFNCS